MNNIYVELEHRIEQVLSMLRPYLKEDGGDVVYAGYEEKQEGGINKLFVSVRMFGNCEHCPLNMMTLRAGIEKSIQKVCPDVYRVMLVKSD